MSCGLRSDDITLTDVSQPKQLNSSMETSYIQNLTYWAGLNDMQLNTSKTKEMILGPLAPANLQLSSYSKKITSFKVVGL